MTVHFDELSPGRCQCRYPLWTGADHYFAKLDEDAVRRIRELALSTSQRELGRMFGVRHRTIAAVIERRSWRHV